MEEDGQDAGSSFIRPLAAGANAQDTLAADMAVDGDEVVIEHSDDELPSVQPAPARLDFAQFDLEDDANALYDSDEQPHDPPLDLSLPDGRFPDSTTRALLLAQNEDLEMLHNDTRSYRTGYVFSATMMLHEHPANERDYADDESQDSDSEETPFRASSPHPEQPNRIMYIFRALRAKGCLSRMKKIPIREIKKEETMLVHDEAMWEGLQRSMAFTSETLRMQTRLLESASSLYVNQHSARCARLSCGGVIEMCDAVASGRIRNGFAIVRPPGHHAEPDRAMGFCFYNNVAVAARWLQQKYGNATDETRCKRIMILDWDVHHGNGTQSAFWDDPDILYVSVHRFENGNFYPPGQAGNAYQVGAGLGVGRNVNIPWPCSKMGDGDYLAAFQRIVMPIATEFSPDLVIISAGFDAARGDELGGCDVTPNGYAHMTYDLAKLANGRLVVALEGGYNLDSIAKSAVEVTEVLLGEAPKQLEETAICSAIAYETLRMVEHVQADYWKCMHKELRAPKEDDLLNGDVDLISIASMLSSYRLHNVAERFSLSELECGSDAEATGTHCLCSPQVLDPDTRTVILFAHDMGNLRIELPWLQTLGSKAELAYIVDASAKVVSWAQAANACVIDVSYNAESKMEAQTMLDWRGQHLTSVHDVQMRDNDRQALLRIWDDTINVLLQASRTERWSLNVVLFGLGSGCDAITNLIEKRKVKECVKAVVQVPYQANVPELQKDSMKRKWYFSHCQVFLPHNHKIFHSEDDILATAKRFGKVIRSSETRAAQVLQKEFEHITAFISESLSSK